MGSESNDGSGVVTGSYSVNLPDGRTQTVTYHANDYDGNIAEVTYTGEAQYPPAHAGGYVAAAPVHAVHAVHAPVHAVHAVHAPVVAHAAPVIAHAAPAYHAPAPVVVKEVPEPYTYSYGVADDYSKSNFQASESGDATGVVGGSYSVNLPDGRIQTVIYNADHANGYVAEVSYSGEAVYPPAPAGGYPGEGHAVVAAPAYHA